ncbi:MAG: hypothetical protein Ta2F_00510 [Termitinemataceae bacterium]|nr:MAG: hypothetical protein Ta2F_00510 [Termitinemataceae bacterium]
MLFDENDFEKRMRLLVDSAWHIFQRKIGNNLININKEASMQLHFAYILQALVPLIIYENNEQIEIELEKTVKLNNGSTCEVDVFITGNKEKLTRKIAIEMKCYKEFASSGGKRGALDIFMKDVYSDIEVLEKYRSEQICNESVFLALTDYQHIICPEKKTGKCWDYDISANYKLTPKTINIPIGGKEQSIKINGTYTFDWQQQGEFYFLEL